MQSLESDSQWGEAVWTVLGGSQTLGHTLVQNPQLLDVGSKGAWLEHPRTPEGARAACRNFCFAQEDRRDALRLWRERELLRIALRDLVLNAPSPETTQEIALLAGACLDLAWDETQARAQSDANAVLALGEFGGQEMHFSSALDLAFVCDTPSPTHVASAAQFAQQLTTYLGGETDNASWNVITSLRRRESLVFTTKTLGDHLTNPRSGLGVSGRQALTRARFAAGDSLLGARALTSIRGAAHPPGWDFDWNDELLQLKERAERQRAQKNSGDTFDVKFAPGALGDIEWAASWMALKHGHNAPGLQVPNTRAQLLAARGANLLAGVESNALIGAYDWFRRAQLRLQIARDGELSSVKRDSSDFTIWARAVLPTQPASDAPVVFEETWRAHAQNVRMIFERVRDML